LSDNLKTYLTVTFVFTFIVFGIIKMSTGTKFSCDGWANNFKDSFQCNIVLHEKKRNAGIVTLSKFDLEKKGMVECNDYTKWIGDNFEKFHKGDTIIKRKGEYSSTIKRKNKTIVIPFECDKVYVDK
jgi:hypothetical protein